MSLVSLHASTSTGAPVFLVHGVMGTVLPYRELAVRLGADRPCIGIEARGVDGRQEPLDCVEALAAAYLDEVRARGAPARWLLAGWSFGGLVAYEMAVQLGRAGIPACAALLDTQALLDPKRHTRPPRKEIASGLDRHLERAGVPREDLLAVERLRTTYVAHVEALLRYHPGRFTGPLTVIHAGQGLPTEDATLGFGAVAGGPVRTHGVAGDHDSLLAPPHVDAVSGVLRDFFASFDPDR
ncbi:alpha/beta fold hydrolase [Pyxidicoccus trucidator]|uniref:thioesterase domain-containing protein n=1 Tax=Pyxidicoccus trucidator TaxID=2709662 RepID=UPI0013DAE9C9|nr:alpha/beta fold hydrolase [Pyxidicoccus trucidator]